MTFDEAFEFVFNEEGGYVNDPDDPGGETSHGISKKSFPHLNIKGLTKETVKPLYRIYWDAIKGDYLPPWLRLPVFDFGFNAGTKTAIKLLQRLADVEPDGMIGKITLAAAVTVSNSEYLQARKDYYDGLVKKRPVMRKFLKGWKARSDRAYKASSKYALT